MMQIKWDGSKWKMLQTKWDGGSVYQVGIWGLLVGI